MTRLFALLMLLVPWPAAAANICDYWPVIPAGRQQVVQFQATQGTAQWLGLTARYVNRGTVGGQPVLRMDEWSGQGWQDAWELRCVNGEWLEVGDWTPAGHKVYTIGKEIRWGGNVSVGQTFSNQIHVNVAASTGETTGIHNWGTQIVTFEEAIPSLTTLSGEVYTDVLKINVTQSWCIAAYCAWPAGQATWRMRYWLARGIGIVQVQYLQAPGQTFDPPRIDYAKAAIVTQEMP